MSLTLLRTLLPQKSAPLGHIFALPVMNDSLPTELKFRENIGPGLRGEKMLTYAIWHGFLAAQPLDLFVEIDHNQLPQYCNLPIFSVNGM